MNPIKSLIVSLLCSLSSLAAEPAATPPPPPAAADSATPAPDAAAPANPEPAKPVAEASDAPPPPALVRISAEVDPLDYTWYKGWGVFVAARVAALPRWRFRIGVGSASIPDVFVNMVPENKGWQFRLDPVLTFATHFTLWQFHNGRGGLFVGPVVGWMRGVFTSPDGGRASMDTGFVGADIGFRWYPFQKLGLVISPHLGAISTLGNQAPAINGAAYKVLPVIPQPQLLIGYEFDFGKASPN
jgi:hypothetical protein